MTKGSAPKNASIEVYRWVLSFFKIFLSYTIRGTSKGAKMPQPNQPDHSILKLRYPVNRRSNFSDFLQWVAFPWSLNGELRLILNKIQIWPDLPLSDNQIAWFWNCDTLWTDSPIFLNFCSKIHFHDLQVCTNIHPQNNWKLKFGPWDVYASTKVHPWSNWKFKFDPGDCSYSMLVFILVKKGTFGQIFLLFLDAGNAGRVL